MKRNYLLMGMLCLSLHTFSQNFHLISSTENQVEFNHELQFKEANYTWINGSDYQDFSKTYKITTQETGKPELPVFSESVLLPNKGSVSIEIEYDAYSEYQNVLVAPSKGSLKRNVNPDNVPYTFDEVYNEDNFFPGNLANLRSPFVLRNTRGVTVELYPYQYNPVTQTLRVYHNIRVKVVTDTKESGENEIETLRPEKDAFNSIYKDFYINANELKYTAVEETGDMLIIAKDDYIDEIQDLADWKTQAGMKTTVVGTSTAGTTDTAIKAYVESFYASNPNLVFILLVGDHADVPSHTYGNSGGEQLWSDTYYGQLAGGVNDYFPEAFVGRFSGSASQITTMVDRTLEYEKNPASGNWMTNAIGLASNEGSGIGDDGEADWQHARNTRTKLLSFGYNTVYEFYDGNHGGDDASGDPNATGILTAVNAGVGLFNYTGHGDQNTCVSGNFTTSNINTASNNGMYPFVISVACNNGTFTSGTCISETWLRATNAGTPSGGIAACGSSILMAWAEPMQTQDEMTEILTEAYMNNRKVTLGGLFYNGQLSMLEQYNNTNAREVMQTWVFFGDPSTLFRTKETMNMTVNHYGWAALGETSLDVTCNIEGANVALVHDGEIIGKGTVSGGVVHFTFDPIMTNSPIIVTATKQNYKPYNGNVIIGDGVAAINELLTNTFEVYPNPASKTVMVKLNGEGDVSKLQLVDLSGKVVISREQKISGETTESLDLNGVNPGVYFLNYIQTSGRQTVKLIIE